MKIVGISDTHEQHLRLTIPECDILVHAGDASGRGSFFAMRDFKDWLIAQPAKRKIYVAGNHDMSLDKSHRLYQEAVREMFLNCNEIIYLEDTGIVIDGVHFYGTPWTPWFYDWGFNAVENHQIQDGHPGPKSEDVYEWIPQTTNVLICHGPPHGIVDRCINVNSDERLGSMAMRKRVLTLPNLKLFFCGHLHEARGHDIVDGVHYCNVASLDRDYRTLRPPVVIDLDGSVKSVEGYNV